MNTPDLASTSPIIERLKLFMQHTGMSNSQFADYAGIPRPTLSQLLHGRNKSVNDSLLRKLYEKFPSLDVRWLLFGLGSMLTDANSQTSEPKIDRNLDYSNADGAVNKELSSANTDISDEPAKLPKEISDVISGASKRPSGGEREIPGASQAAEPFFYEVRPMSDVPTRDEVAPTEEKNERTSSKKIRSILVLYTDGSFETFNPEA
ncbi:MAG: helix-turn-helix domain-containing protein [Muribaculaceae bacterium]|nr:helix-turn-helix domain-containing protein [Muribaculaceae bacterium]